MRVAIVVLTYNGRDLIDACLAAVQANTDLSRVQLVVVDNASADGTAAHVAQAHPGVHLVRNATNLGFAGGVDAGIAAVEADAYVLLNSDARVTPGWLERLASSASTSDVGIVGALEVDEAGAPRWGPSLPPVELRVPEDRDTVSFACALIRREVVDRIGGLDPGFFMYREDWDYCRRARAAGFRIVFEPRAVVVHPGEATFGAQPSAWRARVRTASRLREQAIHWSRPRRALAVLREPLFAAHWARQGLLRPYLQGVRDARETGADARRRRADPTGYVPLPSTKRPLHVAMAIPWPSWNRAGGAERHVHELASALVKQGVRVTVLVPGPAPPPPSSLPYAAHVIESRVLRSWQVLRGRLPVGATVAKRAYDRAFNRLAARAAQAAGADVLQRHFVHEDGFRPALPLVYTLHNGDLPRDQPAGSALARRDQRAREAGLRQGIEDADAVICVSGHVRDSVLGRLGVARDPAVIYNGCSNAPPTLSKEAARQKLGLGKERVVLFIGHLWRHKRVPRLLPLLDEPDVHLVLIGTGELEDKLRARALTEPRLRLLGFVSEDEKRLWLRAADVLALPSGTFEGNPLVMLEALRAGTPVYGTMAGWLPADLRKYGRFGDEVQLALEAMALDAEAAVAEVQDWDAVATQTLAVYRGVVGASRDGAGGAWRANE